MLFLLQNNHASSPSNGLCQMFLLAYVFWPHAETSSTPVALKVFISSWFGLCFVLLWFGFSMCLRELLVSSNLLFSSSNHYLHLIRIDYRHHARTSQKRGRIKCSHNKRQFRRNLKMSEVDGTRYIAGESGRESLTFQRARLNHCVRLSVHRSQVRLILHPHHTAMCWLYIGGSLWLVKAHLAECTWRVDYQGTQNRLYQAKLCCRRRIRGLSGAGACSGCAEADSLEKSDTQNYFLPLMGHQVPKTFTFSQETPHKSAPVTLLAEPSASLLRSYVGGRPKRSFELRLCNHRR